MRYGIVWFVKLVPLVLEETVDVSIFRFSFSHCQSLLRLVHLK